tara:strand:+ start:304 stop:1728 length:1425 start_codon:yes stop_codon:yes gene_type:complete
MKNSKIINKLPTLITIAASILIFQMIGMYESKFCKNDLIFKTQKRNVCNLIDNTKLTFPANYVLDNYKILKRILLKGTSSGTAADNMQEVRERFGSFKSGFTFYYPESSRENSGFILLSKADPQRDGVPLIELWDLNKQSMIFKWDIDLNQILKVLNYKIPKNSFVLSNPLLLEDGNLIALANVANEGKLVKISPDSKLLKYSDEFIFHHSIETDNHKKIFVPIILPNKFSNNYIDEGFAILDEDLNVIKTFSLTDIFLKSGLGNYIFSTNIKVPFHLNDVVPLNDPNETNVVLMSIRSMSSIISYNIKSGKILWILSGYGNRQHDVDIVNDNGSYISIFDNNVNKGKYSKLNYFTTIKNLPINKEYPLLIFNYKSNHKIELDLEVNRENFNFLSDKNKPKTITSGQSEYLPKNNSVFIEESNYGRSFEYDKKNKKLLWQYINRNDKKDLYFMKFWSRRLEKLPTFFDLKKSKN